MQQSIIDDSTLLPAELSAALKKFEDKGSFVKKFQLVRSTYMCVCMASLLRLTSLFLQMFVPVFDSDGRWLVFCYNQRHNQFEFLSCDESIDY